MPLKTILDSLDGVDDATKAHYTEADGKFVLQIEGVDLHPDVANLKSAFERTKAAEKDARTKLTAAEQRMADALKDKPDEAAIVKLRTDLEAERDGWKSKFEDVSGKLLGVTRDQSLREALAASGIADPAFQKAATMMLRDSLKVDGDKVIAETDMGPMPVADYVKRWSASEGKAFVAPASGGGAKGQDQGGKGGSIKRSDFDAMAPLAKSEAMKQGATIVD
jgi:exonuclease VII small subunit